MAWQFNSEGMGAAIGRGIKEADEYIDRRKDRAEDVRLKKGATRAELEAQALLAMKGYRKPEFDEEGIFKTFGENPEARERNLPILKGQLPQFFEKKIQEAKPFEVLSPKEEPLDDLTAKINAEQRRRNAAGDLRPVTMADVSGPSAIAPTAPVSPAPPPAPAGPPPLLANPDAAKQDLEREKLVFKASGDAIKAKGAAAEADSITVGNKVEKGAGPKGEDVQYASKTGVSFDDGVNVDTTVSPEQPEIKDTFNPTPEMMADIQNRAMSAPQRDADVLVPNATIPAPIREILGLPETGQTPTSLLKALLDFKKPAASSVDKTLPPGTYDAISEIEAGIPLSVAARKLTMQQKAPLSPGQAAELRSAEARRIAREQKDAQIGIQESDRQEKKTQAQEKKQKAIAEGAKTAGFVTSNVDKILDILDKNPRAVGPWRGKLSALPGTDAQRVNDILETIKANASFDKLQAMREASPTGGALGQVSDFENKLLQATMGKTVPDMNAGDLRENLEKIKEIYGKFQAYDPQENSGREPKGGGESSGDFKQTPEERGLLTLQAETSAYMKAVDESKKNASEKRILKKKAADNFLEKSKKYTGGAGIPWGRKDGSEVP